MTHEKVKSPAGGDHEQTGNHKHPQDDGGAGRHNVGCEPPLGEHSHGHRPDDGIVIRWKLNVQGVEIETPRPRITVRDAIKQAGFNPDSPWIIILKVTGEPKKEVDLSFEIDLRHKGIEKLRLTPRQINNGEMTVRRRLEFALLPQDEEHLDCLGLRWETLLDAGRRWLVIRSYPVPAGYCSDVIDIAIEVPVSYPGAQLDMFYCHPVLMRRAGGGIPQTEHRETITGLQFQRWSRHRQWDVARDTLATHLTLVEEALRREVEP
ncbi:MAG: E2/UBC family protein [Alphaproteobacteria bacterium]